MQTAHVISIISFAIFAQLAKSTVINPNSTDPAVFFSGCSLSQQNTITTAWNDALAILESVDTIDKNAFSTYDWWGPDFHLVRIVDYIQASYTEVQHYLARSSNSSAAIHAFCGDPPSRDSCTTFADLGLARRDPWAGFYSYAYTEGDGAEGRTVNVVFCDTFFNHDLLQPLDHKVDKICNESSHNSISPYWLNHGSEFLRQIFLVASNFTHTILSIEDGEVQVPVVTQYGLGGFDFTSYSIQGYGNNWTSAYSPEMAKLIARVFYLGAGFFTIHNVGNWVGYALSHYVKGKVGEMPYYPIVTGRLGGSDLCNERKNGPGEACSTVVLYGTMSAVNNALVPDHRWYDNDTLREKILPRPNNRVWPIFQQDRPSTFVPNVHYSRTYTSLISALQERYARQSPNTTRIPKFEDIHCVNGTASSISLETAYNAVQRLCRRYDLKQDLSWSLLEHTSKLTLKSSLATNATTRSAACSPSQCVAAFYEGMSVCMWDPAKITGMGGNASVACDTNSNGTFSWEIKAAGIRKESWIHE